MTLTELRAGACLLAVLVPLAGCGSVLDEGTSDAAGLAGAGIAGAGRKAPPRGAAIGRRGRWRGSAGATSWVACTAP